MNKQIAYIAKMKTPEPSGRFDIVKESGITADIMQAIFVVFEKSWQQTKEFAKEFLEPRPKCLCEKAWAKANLKEAAKVWRFVKDNIKYKLDPTGTQLIKTPSVTIRDGYGDCKAYSILIASLLKNLNIPFVFRLVTYDPSNTDVTHIYVVAKIGREEIPLDACLNRFGVEKKPYYQKIDKDMTKIIAVSGIGNTKTNFRITKFSIDPLMNAGELDLLLTRERLELERAIKARKGQINGIGAINEDIAILNQAINQVRQGKSIQGIADFIGRRKPGGTKFGNFLRKVGKGIKAGVKAVTRTLTLPMRLAAKGILEISLPKSAYYFLPLFATDAQATKIGAAFVKERNRARKRANFIIKKIGMKEDHFMKIVRNGIMKRKGKSPEMIINNLLTKGARIAGFVAGIGYVNMGAIGIAPLLVAQAAPLVKEGVKDLLAPLFEILNKIISLFGKKDKEAADALENGEATIFEETVPLNSQGLPETQNPVTNTTIQPQTQYNQQPVETYQNNFNPENQLVNTNTNTTGENYQNNSTADENNNNPPDTGGNNNSLLIAAGVGLALLALSGKK